VEAEFPADIVDARLNQAVAILEDLLKPVVCHFTSCLFLLALNICFASNLALHVSLIAVLNRMSPWTTTRNNS